MCPNGFIFSLVASNMDLLGGHAHIFAERRMRQRYTCLPYKVRKPVVYLTRTHSHCVWISHKYRRQWSQGIWSNSVCTTLKWKPLSRWPAAPTSNTRGTRKGTTVVARRGGGGGIKTERTLLVAAPIMPAEEPCHVKMTSKSVRILQKLQFQVRPPQQMVFAVLSRCPHPLPHHKKYKPKAIHASNRVLLTINIGESGGITGAWTPSLNCASYDFIIY